MADSLEAETKPRKSVSFEVDAMENGAGEPPNGAAPKTAASGGDSTEDKDKDVDAVTEMFKGLTKKKKGKKTTTTTTTTKEGAADGLEADDAGTDAAGALADSEFDPSALKKKKKKKSSKTAGEAGDSFEAKLAEAGVGVAADWEGKFAPLEVMAGEAPYDDAPEDQEGDLSKGTGIWAHDATAPISYGLLLTRFYSLLHSHHPDLASSGSKSYKIPPPQCLREGNKKTIFANISEICKRMKRSDEHVTQYLFAELGTSGSTDGSRRLVIRGRFQQKQIENVLRRYIMEYVTCKTCRSPDTELSKGENRLYFVTCNSCGSRRSVTTIKTGFSAQIGKRRRQQG
ncbi:MAG: hypothetical protein M1826_003692 [Phylliscum demangeonii]|nr:MAG: hypothetical protein M1826_003692 [Phylliscum demangeonii]